MGRLPPKASQVKSGISGKESSDSSPPATPAAASGPSTRRVTRSSPTKTNKSPPKPPVHPKKRIQTRSKASSQEAVLTPRKVGVAKEVTPSPTKKGQTKEESDDSESSEEEDDNAVIAPKPNVQRPQSQPSTSVIKKEKSTASPKKKEETSVTKISAQPTRDRDVEEESEESASEPEDRPAENSKPDKQNARKTITKQKSVKVIADNLSDSEAEEKQVEKLPKISENEDDINEGRNVLAVMTTDEINELLERIDDQCSPLDKVHVRTRENLMDWNKVAFSSYGPRQCQIAWVFLRQQSRKIRILSEVVNEIKLKFSTSKTYQAKLVESMPGFPQKPPNTMGGFHYFNRQEWEHYKAHKSPEDDLRNFVKYQRECKEKYNALSNAEKASYEDLSKLALAEYNRKVKKFYAENPGLAQLTARLREEAQTKKDKQKVTRVKASRTGTVRKRSLSTKSTASRSKSRDLSLPDPYEDSPQPPPSPAVHFIQSKLNRLDTAPTSEELPQLKNKFFEKWQKLPTEKRLNWIDYCIKSCIEYTELIEEYKQEHPEFIPKEFKIKQILSKDELSLWETAKGRPVNPKLSVFDVFYEEYLESNENADLPEDERRKVAHTKWEEMDWYHKEMYKMKYKISMVEYKKSIQNYFSTLPEFLKPACLTRVPKKFLKMLEEVDKLPNVATPYREAEVETRDEHEIIFGETHEGDHVDPTDSQEEDPPKKKKKKDKKKKRRKDLEDEVEEEEHSSFKYEEPYQQHVEEKNNEMEVDEPSYERKKKKKKKRRDNEEEYETITGDIFSDSQSEGPNHLSDPLGRQVIERMSESGPLFKHNPTGDDIDRLKLFKKQTVDFKVSRSVGAELELLRASGSKPVHVVKESFVKKLKPSSKFFPQGHAFVQNDIFEAVRGIFDGRAHLGRKYSVYYYYAKYVSSEKTWIDSVNVKGLEKTALKIIKTFLCLNDYQKETFIDQSFRFYFDKVHGTKILMRDDIPINSTAVLFPGEPKPPPTRAKRLYLMEMEKRKRRNTSFVYPSWDDLDERLQTFYIKKLYHDSKVYLKRYDQFFSSMTPNDLVEYTVERAKIWEQQLYQQQSLIYATREFVFPLPVREFCDIGLKSEPEITYQNTQTPANLLTKQCQRRLNPFSNNNVLDNIVKNMQRKGKRRKKKEDKEDCESNDDPSGDEENEFSLCSQAKMKKKIRNAAKYFYNLDDLFPNENIDQNQLPLPAPVEIIKNETKSAKCQTNSKAYHRTKSTQTEVKFSKYSSSKGALAEKGRKVASVLQNIACKIVASAGAKHISTKSNFKRNSTQTVPRLKVNTGAKSKKKLDLAFGKRRDQAFDEPDSVFDMEVQDIPTIQSTELEIRHQETSGKQLQEMHTSTTSTESSVTFTHPNVFALSPVPSFDYDIPSPLKPVAEFGFTENKSSHTTHIQSEEPENEFYPMQEESTDLTLL